MNSLPFSTHGQSLTIGEAKGENKNYLGQFSYFVRTMVAWKPVKVGIWLKDPCGVGRRSETKTTVYLFWAAEKEKHQVRGHTTQSIMIPVREICWWCAMAVCQSYRGIVCDDVVL